MTDKYKHIEYWKSSALSDIDTALILIEKDKIKEGLFFCHLTIEKMLKAHFVKEKEEVPPRSHDLLYFQRKLSINFVDNQLIFMAFLIKFHLEGRYPDYNPPIILKKDAINYHLRTKELLEWLIEKL